MQSETKWTGFSVIRATFEALLYAIVRRRADRQRRRHAGI